MMKLGTLLISLILTVYINTAKASEQPASPDNMPEPDIAHHSVWVDEPAAIWQQLQHLSSAQLMALQQAEHTSEQEGWLRLALINKQYSADTAAFTNALQNWRITYPAHPAAHLIPSSETLSHIATDSNVKQIAVLLPLQGSYGKFGQRIKQGLLSAYYANMQKDKKIIKFYDTSQTQNLTDLYNKAITDGADFVIGPLTKQEVHQFKHIEQFKVPTLALNYLDNNPASIENFYEFGLLPEDEITQMAYRAHDAGLSKAIIIAPDSGWGKKTSETFLTYWRTAGGNVQDIYYYSNHANFADDIAHLLQIDAKEDKELMHEANDKEILEDQRRQDFDVIFLFASPDKSRLIVPILRYNYVSNVPIYAPSSVLNTKFNPVKDADLAGLFICDIPGNPSEKQNNQHANDRLQAVGQDAYLLSQSLTRLRQIPAFPIYGATGALSLSENHLIHRSVPCHALKTSPSQ